MENLKMKEEWMSVSEASLVTGRSTWQIRRWLGWGWLVGIRPNGDRGKWLVKVRGGKLVMAGVGGGVIGGKENELTGQN